MDLNNLVGEIERVFVEPETGAEVFAVVDSLVWHRSCGGVRLVADGSLREARILARAMTEKYRLFGDLLPMGGAKTVIRAPGRLVGRDREHLFRFVGEALADLFGRRRYFPWTDMGTDAHDIETLLRAGGVRPYPLVNTAAATAWTVLACIQSVADHLSLPTDQRSVALEGLGSVSTTLARELVRAGFRVVGVSTEAGTVFRAEGLPVETLIASREQWGTDFVTRVDGEHLPASALFELPCAFLVPGARPESIHSDTALQARAVVPAANAPYGPGVVDALARRGVCCFPDAVSNAGGIWGACLDSFGMSRPEIRRFLVHAWRQLASQLLRLSAGEPQHMLDLVRILSRDPVSPVRSALQVWALDPALRRTRWPGVLRATGARWLARRAFARLRQRLAEAALP